MSYRLPRRAEVATSAGRFIWLSGCAAVNDQGDVVGGGDPTGQTQYIFERLGSDLAGSGATFDDLAELRIYLTDIRYAKIIELTFHELFLAGSCCVTVIEVAALLHPDALMEAEGVAFVKGPGREARSS
jgi:enamine deaminase RidA (YjgF/YER057c/UK114 family)